MTSDVPGKLSPSALARWVATAFALAALTLAGSAHATQANLARVGIDLGTVSVLGGTVILTGSVGDDLAGASLRINGKPVTVTAGTFSAVVDLEEDKDLVLALDGDHADVTTRIPLSVLVSEGSNALKRLEDAGISVEVSEGGFKVVDGVAPLVTGAVQDSEGLKSFEVNGADMLRQVGAGGTFSTRPQDGIAAVTVSATDPQGVSQTTSFSTTRVSSTVSTSAGTSVSAAGANGIRIAKVHLVKNRLRSVKRFRVVVTVKDRRGYLVRGAALRITGKPRRFLAAGDVRAGFTNRVGRSNFAFRVHPRAFKRCGCARLAIRVRASTPTAVAKKQLKLRVPARRGA